MSDNMLWQSNNNADPYTVRGDTKGFAGSEQSRPMDSGAPIWLEGMSVDANATNSMGPVGDTGSDPMFDKFKHFATGNADEVNQTGSNSAESVAGSAMQGTDSDAPGERLPDEQSVGAGAPSNGDVDTDESLADLGKS